jgi:CrcB protein
VTLVGLAGVAVAGALGAPARFLVDGWVQRRRPGIAPWGTFVVNVSGSFLLGLVTGAAIHHGFTGAPRLWLATGFCGAYTTFSTFSFETVRLLEEGASREAAANVLGSVVVGAAAAAAGLALAAPI